MTTIVVIGLWPAWARLPIYVIGCAGIGLVFMCGITSGCVSEKKNAGWLSAASFIGCLLVISAVIDTWNEKRVILTFVQSLLAYGVTYGGPIAGGVAGYFLGQWVHTRWHRLWLAWTVGVVICGFVAGAILELGCRIPGVEWRMDRILEHWDD